jgi:hypothetical protein
MRLVKFAVLPAVFFFAVALLAGGKSLATSGGEVLSREISQDVVYAHFVYTPWNVSTYSQGANVTVTVSYANDKGSIIVQDENGHFSGSLSPANTPKYVAYSTGEKYTFEFRNVVGTYVTHADNNEVPATLSRVAVYKQVPLTTTYTYTASITENTKYGTHTQEGDFSKNGSCTLAGATEDGSPIFKSETAWMPFNIFPIQMRMGNGPAYDNGQYIGTIVIK